MPIFFRPRLIPTLATFVVIAITLSLGRWQSGRAMEKMALQASFKERIKAPAIKLDSLQSDRESLRYRRVFARGTYLEDKQIFLDNKIQDEHAGYHVITPLRLSGTQANVLVNRGWIGRGRNYPAPPPAPPPAGEVEVSGMAVLPVTRFVELSAANVDGRVWQNLTILRVREKLGIDVLPILVLAEKASPGLAVVTETPDAGIDTHRIYAFQWFSLAAVAAVFWLAVYLKRERT
jgi:surfeit locus 1 family protein